MADEEEEVPQPVWAGSYDEDGKPQGTGTMKYPPAPVGEDEEEKPGDTFEGTFEHGLRHGKGKYTWGKSGAVFQGVYDNGLKSGQGKLVFPDKSIYDGDWENDTMQGQGTYVYASGDMYVGGFSTGKREGKGMYNNQQVGCQFVGEWSAGGFVSGHWVLKDGSMFNGSFKDGVNPVEGAYYFSRSGLLQAGGFNGGDNTWQGRAPPIVGTVDKLAELAISRPAAKAF